MDPNTANQPSNLTPPTDPQRPPQEPQVTVGNDIQPSQTPSSVPSVGPISSPPQAQSPFVAPPQNTFDNNSPSVPSGPLNVQAPAPTPAPLPNDTLTNVPETWPGAFGIYKYSRYAVRLIIVPLLILYLFSFIINAIIEWKLGIAGRIIAYLIGSLMQVAIALLVIAGVRRQRLSLGETLNKSLPLFLKIIGLNILLFVSYAVSLLLLIIPFFFVLPRLTLATYFLVDKKMGVIEAYKASWASTKGHSGKIWGIIGVSFLMALLMITVISIPVAIYFLLMYSAAFGVLYEFLNKQQPSVASASSATAINPIAAPPSPPAVTQPPQPTTIEPTSSSAPPNSSA